MSAAPSTRMGGPEDMESLIGRNLHACELVYEWEYDKGKGLRMLCLLDFFPAEKLWNGSTGAAYCQLLKAFIAGQNCSALLSGHQIDRIEELALAKHGEDAQEAAAERQIEAYQARQYG